MFPRLPTLLCLCLLSLTGCEITELKDASDDVIDVRQNGVDLITEAGNRASDAMQRDSD